MTNRDDLHKLLEFDKIVTFLKQNTLSDIAKERFDTLDFMRDKTAVEKALQEVSEFVAILEDEESFPLQAFDDVRGDLERTEIAGIHLRVEAFVRIVNILTTSRRVRAYLQSRAESFPHLWEHAQMAVVLKELESEISGKIDLETQEIRDSASVQLAKIRKSIAHSETKAKRTMDRLFKSFTDQGYLQEELVTIRDGRFVFPVKQESKAKVKGLVHDYSASGATLFVEPYDVVEVNNEIKRLRGEEAQEVDKILRELTTSVQQHTGEVGWNLGVLSELDFIQAKAGFARQFDCHVPLLVSGETMEIIGGRHPLLLMREENRDSIVPLTLTLANSVRTLVITGPNAGGKTVALKTVGLLVMMLQSGIPIPASSDSKMPIFQRIFADIGDFQSIEQDLSSFTAHLRQVRFILDNAEAGSLVLIDEIGGGTDPDEGAAFATAFLQELTKRSCTTIVTTHHGALKEFAHHTPGVENASMEFSANTLQPTYKFRSGIPGSSYALEIAKRVGIPDSVLQAARNQLGSNKERLEKLIIDLEKKAQASTELAKDLELENTRLKGLAKLYNERNEALKKNEKALKQKALAQAEEILKQANASVERAIKEIREQQASSRSISEAKQRLAREREKVAKAIASLEDEKREDRHIDSRQVRIGKAVFWKRQGVRGKIVSEADSAGNIVIQVDNFKFRVPLSEVLDSNDENSGKPSPSSVKVKMSPKTDLLPEIDVRGQSLDEAITTVDKFLDDALLAGWSQVRLIHGKGLGVLRKGIDDFLSEHPRVKSKRMGAWNEGDLGVTVVDLN